MCGGGVGVSVSMCIVFVSGGGHVCSSVREVKCVPML